MCYDFVIMCVVVSIVVVVIVVGGIANEWLEI